MAIPKARGIPPIRPPDDRCPKAKTSRESRQKDFKVPTADAAEKDQELSPGESIEDYNERMGLGTDKGDTDDGPASSFPSSATDTIRPRLVAVLNG